MEISVDKQADALYIKFSDGKFSRNRVVNSDMIIDYDTEDNILGIEILNASKRLAIGDMSSFEIKLKTFKENVKISKILAKPVKLKRRTAGKQLQNMMGKH
jgi:uncharacterized protein YuzE